MRACQRGASGGNCEEVAHRGRASGLIVPLEDRPKKPGRQLQRPGEGKYEFHERSNHMAVHSGRTSPANAGPHPVGLPAYNENWYPPGSIILAPTLRNGPEHAELNLDECHAETSSIVSDAVESAGSVVSAAR